MRVLQYPGSKWSYLSWICPLIPEHEFYLEPFLGSGAVFFSKAPAAHETINDRDGDVVNLFYVCREYPKELAHAVALTPYSREEFMATLEPYAGGPLPKVDCPIENARRFLVRCNQSFGSSTADRVGWKNSKSPSGPQNARTWSTLPDKILQVTQRLQEAQIENTDGVQLLRDCNHPDCFAYVDPPYPLSLRKGRYYRHEMGSEAEHIQLLEVLKDFSGMVMLSGYENALYNEYLVGWHKSYRDGLAQHAGERTEVLWMNYQQQMTLQDITFERSTHETKTSS